VVINKKKYINDILKRFNMLNYNLTNTHVKTNLNLSNNDDDDGGKM